MCRRIDITEGDGFLVKSLTIPLLQGNLNEETFNLEMCLFYLEKAKRWVEESRQS